ncbi:MAG: hypothetical protein FJY86_03475 [Candidatus Diapherotrites archaeon]|uniref:Uncharacterized protein n=1 Tax=Candidatus Iainarchaeum sp. TaxID=3101447 RepID=A0A8T4C835_9ARCH|nr:hypothetical protein [Candidatus Diapherotrites archaeon]
MKPALVGLVFIFFFLGCVASVTKSSPAPGCIEYENGLLSVPPIGGCFGKTTFENFSYSGPSCLSISAPNACTGGNISIKNDCATSVTFGELAVGPTESTIVKPFMQDGRVEFAKNIATTDIPYPTVTTPFRLEGMVNGDPITVYYVESARFC